MKDISRVYTEKAELSDQTNRVCPLCEGREAGLLDPLCQAHFDALPRPSREDMRDAMERGRRNAEAYRQAVRYRRIR